MTPLEEDQYASIRLTRSQELRLREALKVAFLQHNEGTQGFDVRADEFVRWLKSSAVKHVATKGGVSRLRRQLTSDLRMLQEAKQVLERHAHLRPGRGDVVFYGQAGPMLASDEAAQWSETYHTTLGSTRGPLDQLIHLLEEQLTRIPAGRSSGARTFVPDWHGAVLEKYKQAIGARPNAESMRSFRQILAIARKLVTLPGAVRDTDLQKLLAS